METTASRRTSGDQVKLKNIFSPFFLSFFSFSNLRLLNSHTSPIKITQSWSNSFLLSLTKLEPCLAETLVPLKNLGPMETVEMLLLAGIQAAPIWTGARTDDRLFYPCKGMLLPPDKTITIYNYIDMKQIQIPQSYKGRCSFFFTHNECVVWLSIDGLATKQYNWQKNCQHLKRIGKLNNLLRSCEIV